MLTSNKLIDKSIEYGFLHPWLGTGLLTSTGSYFRISCFVHILYKSNDLKYWITGRKWSTRRKLLTPTFHFKILGDFIHVFNEQSQVLIEKLNEAVATEKGGFDIYPFITRCTLDIICGMLLFVQ